MEEFLYWIDGKEVKGMFGCFSDVYNFVIGEVIVCVLLVILVELDVVIVSVVCVQVDWVVINLQCCVCVMMKLGQLINEYMDELVELVLCEYGKMLFDVKGDVQCGFEVIEVCMGVFVMLKGEFIDNGGFGIDFYFMCQLLGVVVGIMLFNFLVMILLWKMGLVLVLGNVMILKLFECVFLILIMLVKLVQQVGLFDGVLQVVNGDKEIVDVILDYEVVQVVGFVGLILIV